MLSYRHAFHAGNHADVLKHFIFCLVLDYFRQKDKPFWVVDTHAGAGMYALDSGFAQQNAEFSNGIARILQAEHLPQALENYAEMIKDLNSNQTLKFYPGSPIIAQDFLRADDKLRLFELHPSDCQLLIENFKGKGRQTKIEMQNGFAGLKALLPPPSKRALVLIDPPYELKDDYQHVVKAINDSLSRFATGTYLVWYPLLQRLEPLTMLAQLKAASTNWLNVTLSVEAPSDKRFGMFGSGMFVINPPYTLPAILKETMPVLRDLLGQDAAANFSLEAEMR